MKTVSKYLLKFFSSMLSVSMLMSVSTGITEEDIDWLQSPVTNFFLIIRLIIH